MKPSRVPTSPYASKMIPSPVGALTLVASERSLTAILWENDRPGRVPLGALSEAPTHPLLLAAEQQLQDYFAGRRTIFDLPYDLSAGGTAFQQEVWRALQGIPFGQTRTYAQIAQQIGRPKAIRAVGAAIGRNPLSIIVPCHRVIGTGGKLTGFAGGLSHKAALLTLEKSAVML